MKKNIYLMAAIVAIVLAGTGEIKAQKETRDVSEFTKVSFGISGNLYLKQGNNQSVVLEGDDLDEIETDVSGGKLRIRRKDKDWGMEQSQN